MHVVGSGARPHPTVTATTYGWQEIAFHWYGSVCVVGAEHHEFLQ